MQDGAEDRGRESALALERRHLRIGWWALLVFVGLGIVLETMHGFKVAWYVSVGQETRRLLWRLTHAHGTMLALVHVAFAVTVRLRPRADARLRAIASRCLTGATLALPGGFFLGGLVIYGGDPGLGVFVLPVGAALLLAAVLLTALSLRR